MGNAGGDGAISFRTSRNAISGQTLNGYQLVPFPRPAITAQPRASLSAQAGTDVSLAAGAAGEGALSYQWRKDGSPIEGNPSAATPELKLSAIKATDAGTYALTVTGPGGFAGTVRLAKVKASRDRKSLSATYVLTNPAGKWRQANNGLYTVVLADGRVKDLLGAAAAGGELGGFVVSAR